jgi:putative PIN family toxin of toxin-antitoxin system
MRISVDANIIISAGLFPESNIGKALKHIMRNHNLVLSRYTLDELKEVFEKKFVNRIEYLNQFVEDLKYELLDMKIDNYEKYPWMRDEDDIPLLAFAIEANIDVLITGDKDFDEIKVQKPKIMTARNYMDEYMK